jgi:aminoglycoside 6'-N-acetyltransferase I
VIVRLAEAGPVLHEAAAALLVRALAHMPGAWHDLALARIEVQACLERPERLALAALDHDGALVGWIGAIPNTAELWELHPLVVEPARQRQGCGRRLVRALEAAARVAGVRTIWLGTDDDFGGTSLYGRDLYPDPLRHLRTLAPTARGHPYTFYQACGYAVVGVLPDAGGPGRPDILMARRLEPQGKVPL